MSPEIYTLSRPPVSRTIWNKFSVISVLQQISKMNTAVQLYQGSLSLITTPMPSVNGPNDVLVQIKYCGVCGTDLHIIKGEFPAAEKLILGHEFAGVVAAKGDAVMHVKVGDRYKKIPSVFIFK